MSEIPRLGLPSPSSDDKTDSAGTFGGQLQAARNRHRQTHRFGDDRAQSTEPQGLLEGFKDIFLFDRLYIDDAIRVETDLGQCGSEQVRPSQTPDDHALRPGRDPSNKERSRCPINRPCSASGKLMDRAMGQPAAWKAFVNVGHTEWNDRLGSRDRPFEVLNAISKIGDNWVRGVLRHSEPLPNQVFISLKSEYVPYLFPIGM